MAGKTGTVNNETDVWFIGYTPSYVTGVWMGNPERKVSLGAGMTGGHGAVPYFNAFMIPFRKDKPRESFPGVPPIPADIRTLIERNKREELEKLEKADQAAIKSGAITTTETTGETPTRTENGSNPSGTETTKPTQTENSPPVAKPPATKPPAKETAPSENDKPEGTKRKGKKGDG